MVQPKERHEQVRSDLRGVTAAADDEARRVSGRPVRTPWWFELAPVFLVAGVAGVVLLVGSRHYGYFFDEAYFVVAGRDHPAWGYFDQPPMVPMLARVMSMVAPDSLVALRLPVTLAAVGGIIVTGLIARELGGGRGAQAMAALGYAMSAAVVLCHWLATYSLDPLFWTVIVWLVVRWVRLHARGAADDRLLLAAGLVTALSLQTKFLVPALWVALAVGVLIFGPRRMLTRPMLWAGLAVAALATVPTLMWQARNGWPYTRMSDVVAAESPGVGKFLLDSATSAGIAFGLPLLLIGMVALFVDKRFRDYRFATAASVIVVVAFLLSSGRSNYVVGLYALPMAAGAVVVCSLRWRAVVRPLAAVAAVAGVALWITAVPVYPRSWAERIPDIPMVLTAKDFAAADTMMADLSAVVTDAYHQLPPEARGRTAIVAESYPFAAAVDIDRAHTGLPRAYSAHRGYYYFGHPDDDAVDILYLGSPTPLLAASFTEARPAIPDLATLYTGRKLSWDELWPQLRAQ
ncbi:ArnT family glycosyltransferase [Nocardia transvalensis]|uniref:ArnT family glycosyltransferase n=1 Tax=Nocardia transvalensis TaxID=37333 RepID=UPI0018959AA0|nr:glycosyltransferase family 39 protein [Nocardia transvalensis]MBF6328028.1 glycosyltransferase family 39 protein [Nocardia transvalensis]